MSNFFQRFVNYICEKNQDNHRQKEQNQGGDKCLENLDVAPLSLITLNEDLFEVAYNKEIISENQKNILNKYFEDPEKTMQEFINSHPNFINDVITNGDEKSVKRAKLCLEKGWYTM